MVFTELVEPQNLQRQNSHPGWQKFAEPDALYFHYIQQLKQMQVDTQDLVFQFPVFVGQVNLARYLFFYDLYKRVMELNGHMADVGTYKGASFLFMAKMLKLFEPHNTTQVHGFDWFQGMQPGQADCAQQQGQYQADYDTLLRLTTLQGLSDVAVLHKMDLTQELDGFMDANPHMRFKLVFIDCGMEQVLEKTLPAFWDRLVMGGILIMDHYNCEVSPTESRLVDSVVGQNRIRQIPCNRQPTAYIVKEYA
jgi:hypothetical protein